MTDTFKITFDNGVTKEYPEWLRKKFSVFYDECRVEQGTKDVHLYYIDQTIFDVLYTILDLQIGHTFPCNYGFLDHKWKIKCKDPSCSRNQSDDAKKNEYNEENNNYIHTIKDVGYCRKLDKYNPSSEQIPYDAVYEPKKFNGDVIELEELYRGFEKYFGLIYRHLFLVEECWNFREHNTGLGVTRKLYQYVCDLEPKQIGDAFKMNWMLGGPHFVNGCLYQGFLTYGFIIQTHRVHGEIKYGREKTGYMGLIQERGDPSEPFEVTEEDFRKILTNFGIFVAKDRISVHQYAPSLGDPPEVFTRKVEHYKKMIKYEYLCVMFEKNMAEKFHEVIKSDKSYDQKCKIFDLMLDKYYIQRRLDQKFCSNAFKFEDESSFKCKYISDLSGMIKKYENLFSEIERTENKNDLDSIAKKECI